VRRIIVSLRRQTDIPAQRRFRERLCRRSDGVAANVTRCIATGQWPGLSIEDSPATIGDAALRFRCGAGPGFKAARAADRQGRRRRSPSRARTEGFIRGAAGMYRRDHSAGLQGIRRRKAPIALYSPGIKTREHIEATVKGGWAARRFNFLSTAGALGFTVNEPRRHGRCRAHQRRRLAGNGWRWQRLHSRRRQRRSPRTASFDGFAEPDQQRRY